MGSWFGEKDRKNLLGKEQKGPRTEHEGLENKGVKGWLGKKDVRRLLGNKSVEGWSKEKTGELVWGEGHVWLTREGRHGELAGGGSNPEVVDEQGPNRITPL